MRLLIKYLHIHIRDVFFALTELPQYAAVI